MTNRDSNPVGVFLHGTTPAAEVADMCRLVEDLGYGEIWIAEDCYMLAGFATSAIALQATKDIRVGLGCVASVTRHPAITAMEAATLANAFPGRFTTSIGHGPDVWTKQMGIYPGSILGAMRECIGGLRRLFDGETVEAHGKHFTLDKIGLLNPPKGLPILVAAVGPKSIALAGEIADGLVVSVLAGPKYVAHAHERLSQEMARAGRESAFQLPVYALASISRDRQAARAAARATVAFYLEIMGKSLMTGVYDVNDELGEMLARGGGGVVEKEMPDEWLDWLAICGEPDECAEKIQALLDAGASSVGLSFIPAETTRDQLRLTASEILPKIT
jgi:alkanesulfonate monooxygenase SsuD/methylene tetrahydromethanopterin reductase-like flavin-dependent oxidoreductase (luciferase family)